jgi:hypothetical protein
MAIGVKITVDSSDLLRDLPKGRPTATISSDARTRTGIPIFKLVDQGRGEVRPRRAKALRIPLRGIQFVPAEGGTVAAIFRKRAKAVPPKFIKSRAVTQTLSAVPLISATQPPASSIRSQTIRLLNRVAEFALDRIRTLTPGRSGKLRKSIRLEKAR